MALTDTSDVARRQQLAVFAAMPGADKVLLSSQMAEEAKQIALDGLRTRNPNLSGTEVHEAWLHLLHGELAALLTTDED